jgi:hypothetical protein
MPDMSFQRRAWDSICEAFGAISPRYSPILVHALEEGPDVFSLRRFNTRDIQGEVFERVSPLEALGVISARLATEESVAAYHALRRKPMQPIGALLHARLPGNWGSTSHINYFSRRGTLLYVPSDEAGHPEGWSLAYPLAQVAQSLMDRCLTAPDSVEDADRLDTNPTCSELLRRAGGISLEEELRFLGMARHSDARGGETFHIMDELSRTSYERRAAEGRLLITRESAWPITSVVRFTHPVRLTDTRAARKIIEMTGGNCIALSVDGEISGVARAPQEPIPRSVEIRFLGRHSWSANYGGNPTHPHPPTRDAHPLFIVRDGIPRAAVAVLGEAAFASWAHRLGLSSQDGAILWPVIQSALRAPHGALVVITNAADAEAERLGSRAVRLAGGLSPQPEIIENLAAIDGALIVSTEGRCVAAGAILDGVAGGAGVAALREDRARGARYNSAVRYVLAQRGQGRTCCAVVVSEDRSVDLIPHDPV